jgi:hypothetical protein
VVDCHAWLLVKRFHFFSAFGAKNGGDVVFVHNCFTRQVNEEHTVFVAVAGFTMTVEPIVARTFLRVRWQWLHGFAAPGAEDGGQVVAVHHRFLGQFENEGPLVRMGATLAVAVKFRRHDEHSLYGSMKTV